MCNVSPSRPACQENVPAHKAAAQLPSTQGLSKEQCFCLPSAFYRT